MKYSLSFDIHHGKAIEECVHFISVSYGEFVVTGIETSKEARKGVISLQQLDRGRIKRRTN